ncbi:PREDICTED: uncharacterized protein LOC106819463 [Priapulus caudatus]|uniref:Uncharacterized protein LOC106819463 n=1 Tax=Priapulus caudatus TaxID=37621 RepID=A0ABM1F558_PRICU|nr:PREDICTED: uncharacterized protein LOC106819463 [Priapulus caudatus]
MATNMTWFFRPKLKPGRQHELEEVIVNKHGQGAHRDRRKLVEALKTHGAILRSDGKEVNPILDALTIELLQEADERNSNKSTSTQNSSVSLSQKLPVAHYLNLLRGGDPTAVTCCTSTQTEGATGVQLLSVTTPSGQTTTTVLKNSPQLGRKKEQSRIIFRRSNTTGSLSAGAEVATDTQLRSRAPSFVAAILGGGQLGRLDESEGEANQNATALADDTGVDVDTDSSKEVDSDTAVSASGLARQRSDSCESKGLRRASLSTLTEEESIDMPVSPKPPAYKPPPGYTQTLRGGSLDRLHDRTAEWPPAPHAHMTAQQTTMAAVPAHAPYPRSGSMDRYEAGCYNRLATNETVYAYPAQTGAYPGSFERLPPHAQGYAPAAMEYAHQGSGSRATPGHDQHCRQGMYADRSHAVSTPAVCAPLRHDRARSVSPGWPPGGAGARDRPLPDYPTPPRYQAVSDSMIREDGGDATESSKSGARHGSTINGKDAGGMAEKKNVPEEEFKRSSMRQSRRQRRKSSSGSLSPGNSPVPRCQAFDYGTEEEDYGTRKPVVSNSAHMNRNNNNGDEKSPENTAGKKQLKSKVAEMAEFSETESARNASGGSMDSEDLTTERTGGALEPPVPSKDAVAFPSLPDSFLKKLGLERKSPGDSPTWTEKDLESKFGSLSLAFKTDRTTLDRRRELQQRSRDLVEKNVDIELESMRDSVKNWIDRTLRV